MASWVFKSQSYCSILKPPKGLADWYRYGCNVTQLPAILSLSTKFVPTIMNILKRLADEGQRPAASDRQREMELQPTNRWSYSSVTTATENGPEYSSPVAKWFSYIYAFWVNVDRSSWGSRWNLNLLGCPSQLTYGDQQMEFEPTWLPFPDWRMEITWRCPLPIFKEFWGWELFVEHCIITSFHFAVTCLCDGCIEVRSQQVGGGGIRILHYIYTRSI
jgi:hypothetical protein